MKGLYVYFGANQKKHVLQGEPQSQTVPQHSKTDSGEPETAWISQKAPANSRGAYLLLHPVHIRVEPDRQLKAEYPRKPLTAYYRAGAADARIAGVLDN
jgi:hypothetical protein